MRRKMKTIFSDQDLQVMLFLSSGDKPTAQDLSQKLALSYNAIQASIRRMLKINTVEKCSNGYSESALRLTGKGKTLLDILEDYVFEQDELQ